MGDHRSAMSELGGGSVGRSSRPVTDSQIEQEQHLVAVVYYSTYLKRFGRVLRCLCHLMRPISVRVVINGSEISSSDILRELDHLSVPIYIVQHDNSGLEFGAYQRGLDDIRASSEGAFTCIFVNDTLGTHQPLNKLSLLNFVRAIKQHAGNNVIVGSISQSLRKLQIERLQSSRWVRANLFGIDHQALAGIQYRILMQELDCYIHESPVMDSFFAAEVPNSIRAHLTHDLFEGGWDRSQALSQDNFQRLAKKGRSILQEIYLCMRLDDNSTAFVQPPPLTTYQRQFVKAGLYRI